MNVSSSRWQFYVIPDLKTWSTHAAFQTPLEHFANPADAFARFKELRTAPYNHEPQDFHSNGEPYARLTLGMEQKERQRSLHLLQVRDGQNTLVTDFSALAYTRRDAEVLRMAAQAAEELGFARVMTSAPEKENGVWPRVILPFDEWNSPYFMEIAPASWFERKEKQFLESDNAYALYQLKEGAALRSLRFEAYQQAKNSIDRKNYRPVYTGALPQGTLPQQLNELFQRFNRDYPQDFHGRSLSVSDVIAVRQNGVLSAHYVDAIGFVKLPDFLADLSPARQKIPIQEQLKTASDALKSRPDSQKAMPIRRLEER